ncbi:NACHT domain- and WD repeat-containing protein 1-like isoform X2 [Apostichopus japonicus]|uniref:NACHT domain- and WD repeat-containing protein 1-like isoform X2 n=1 Tax=Stichopus japonicus TaxID=307972 RepID=UPI003AB7940B
MLKCDDNGEDFQPQIRLEFMEHEMDDLTGTSRRVGTSNTSDRLDGIDKRYLSQSSVAFYGRSHSVDSRSDKSWLNAPRSQVARLSLPPMVEHTHGGTNGKKFMSASYAGPDLRGHDLRYSRRRYLQNVSAENSKRVVSFLRKRLQDRDRIWLDDGKDSEAEGKYGDQQELPRQPRVKSVNLFTQYNEVGGRVSKEGHVTEGLYLTPHKPIGGKSKRHRNADVPSERGKVKGHNALQKYVLDEFDDSDGEAEATQSKDEERGSEKLQEILSSADGPERENLDSVVSESAKATSEKSGVTEEGFIGQRGELFPPVEGQDEGGEEGYWGGETLPKIDTERIILTRRASLPGKSLLQDNTGELKLPALGGERAISKSHEILTGEGKDNEGSRLSSGVDKERSKEDKTKDDTPIEMSCTLLPPLANLAEERCESCESDEGEMHAGISSPVTSDGATKHKETSEVLEGVSELASELPELDKERGFLVSPVMTPLPDETVEYLDNHSSSLKNSSLVQDVLEGDIHSKITLEKKIVQLYVSSVLSDMESERTILVSKVFSKGLRQFCKEWGYELQVMDPHWGLKDVWMDNHAHADICLDLLEKCKTAANGPFFLMMVGQKLGYQPLPKQLNPDEFSVITCGIKKEKDALIAAWKTKLAAIESLDNKGLGVEDGGTLISRRMSISSQRSQRRSSVYGDHSEPKEDPEVTAQKAAEKECDDNLVAMETWYKLDLNQLPPAYVLQNISSELRDFTSSDKIKKQRARNQWTVIYKQLLDIIKKYLSEKVLTAERWTELMETLPESELRTALPMGAPAKSDAVYVINRNIPDLRRNLQDFTAKEYIDLLQMKSEVDDPSYERVQNLKYDVLPNVVGEQNIKEVSVRWHKDGISGQSDRTHSLYLDNVSQACHDVLRSRLERFFENDQESKVIPTDVLYEDVAQHALFAQTRCKTFFGRKETLREVKDYLQSDLRQPLVFHGEPGIGKSSIIAKSLELLPKWMDSHPAFIVYRFVGATPSSCNTHALVGSICRQICHLYDLEQSTIPEDFYGVVNDFEVKLGSASSENPLVMLLDGLDEIQTNRKDLSWLPKTLPEHVKMILTTQSGDECDDLKIIKKQCPSAKYLAIPQLSQKEIAFLLNYQLTTADRTLTETQHTVAMEMCQVNPNPLFLMLLCNEASRWRSFAEKRETYLPNELRKLVNATFVQLEHSHGDSVVRRALGYLTAAEFGLSWTELEDLLSLDDTVMVDVTTHNATRLWHFPPGLLCRLMKDLEPWLTTFKMDGVWLYRWSHQEFRHAATERYLNMRDKAPSYHFALAEYYMSKWADKRKPYPGSESGAERHIDRQRVSLEYQASIGPGEEVLYNFRKLKELPHHLLKSNQLAVLKKEILFDFEWNITKLKATSFREVLNDLHSALTIDPNDPELRLLSETLLYSEEALKHDPNQLASQLAGRLSRMIMDSKPRSAVDNVKYPLLVQMINQANNPSSPALIPSVSCLAQPGGILYDLLAGHADHINAVCVSSDGFLAATASKDNSVKLWDLMTRRVLKTISGTGQNVTGIHLYLNSEIVAVVQSNVILVYNFSDGSLVTSIDEFIDPVVVSSAGMEHQYMVAFFSGSNVIRAWDVSKEVEMIFEREFVQVGVHKDRSLCMSLQSHGDKVLYAFRSDSKAYVINVTNGKRVLELQPPKDGASVTALAISRDFYIVACRYIYMTLSEIHQLELFDNTSGAHSRSIRGCTNDVVRELYVNKNSTHALCISPSQQSNSSEIAVWNLDTDEHKHMAKHPQLSSLAACVDLNFFLTASRSDKALRIWNIKKRINERDPSDSGRGTSQRGICQLIPMLNNPRYVVAKMRDNGPLSVWNVVKGKCSGSAVRIERGLTNQYDVVLIRDDRVVILSDRGEATDDAVAVYQTVYVYSLKTKKFIRKVSDTFIVPSPAHEYHLLEGELMMGLSESRDHLIVWCLENGQIKFRIKRSQDSKGWRAPREDEEEVKKRLERAGTAQMTPWDRRSESVEARARRKASEAERERKKLEDCRLEKENPIEQYCLSRDEKVVVCSYFAHHFNVFEVSSQNHLHTLEMEDSMMYLYNSAMTFTGSHLVHTNYNDVEKTSYVTVWDLRKGSLKKRLKNEPNVCCVATNQSADRVVFGNGKNHLKVWDIRRKQSSLRKLRGSSNSFELGEASKIFMIGNGERALVFANDLLLWNLDDGTHLATFTPDLKISCIEVVLDSQLIVLALNDSSDVVTLRLKGKNIKPVDADVRSEGKGEELFGETTGDSTDEEEEEEDDEKREGETEDW